MYLGIADQAYHRSPGAVVKEGIGRRGKRACVHSFPSPGERDPNNQQGKGGKMLKRQSWTREDDTVLQRIYPRALESEVAKQMQRTVWSVKSRAKRLHLTKDAEYRAVLNQTKAQHLREANLTYRINHGYFSHINTRDQAYWLGWLWSDGCVGQQGESYTIELELHKKDACILEQFREAIETDYPLHYRRDAVRLHINSQQMFRDLGKLGIIPQKSILATQPNIEETFVADFIRGVFDGDGYLSIAETKVVGILGTESFCSWLQRITQQEIGIRSAVYRKKNTTFRWAINAQEMIRLFAQWIYRPNEDGSLPLHLERKYARFVSLSLV
jgi:hypothetical protein